MMLRTRAIALLQAANAQLASKARTADRKGALRIAMGAVRAPKACVFAQQTTLGLIAALWLVQMTAPTTASVWMVLVSVTRTTDRRIAPRVHVTPRCATTRVLALRVLVSALPDGKVLTVMSRSASMARLSMALVCAKRAGSVNSAPRKDAPMIALEMVPAWMVCVPVSQGGLAKPVVRS